jgi:hypothetical protein
LLRKLILQQENQIKKYDFAFCGTLSPRRSKIIHQLRSLGYKILCIHSWGTQRDKLITMCNSLLNIHYDEDYLVFEKPRCSRWIKAGFPVVSEKSIKEEETCHLIDINNFPENKICYKINEKISKKIS